MTTKGSTKGNIVPTETLHAGRGPLFSTEDGWAERTAEEDDLYLLRQLPEGVEAYPVSHIKPLELPYFENINVVAGFPIPLNNDELAQNIEILQLLCPHPEASYLVRVQGDSMIGAGIHDGDIIIVDKSNRDPTEREVAVCELNGEYTIKHVVQEGNRAWLRPANPDYPEIEIHPEDDFSVWGTVTYTIHKPRS